MTLYDKLTEYCSSDAYPFHMPGHKRRAGSMQDPFSFDITEIDGFDNLHHPSGILDEAQKRASDLYRSSETRLLVNGSTAGVLSAITACVPPGGLLLMARNSHRSAYHAAGLRNIRTEYLYPVPKGDLNGPIDPEGVERALSDPERTLPDAIFVTSPTYDGVVSDIAAIAQTAHRHGIILIVDEAHGAHFGMHPAFPPSSVTLGADLVIHSLHKTLPSLTQTALLHMNGDLIDQRKLDEMLCVFQTSSPSYVLMASIDSCIRNLSEHGAQLFDSYIHRLTAFREQASALRRTELVPTDDPSRILLRPKHITSGKLYDLLRERYHLQPEMRTVSCVLMLSSVADDEEGFSRLLEALKELENIPPGGSEVLSGNPDVSLTEPPVVRCPLCTALNAPQKRTLFDNASGCVSAEYLYLYPPGVPLLVPGEEITESLIRRIRRLAGSGFEMQGLADYSARTIWTMKEDTPD